MNAVGDGSERAAYAWLSRTIEPGNKNLWAYVESVGPIVAAAEVHSGIAPQRLQRAAGERASEDHSLRDLASARHSGARLVTPNDADWPGEQVRRMAEAAASGADQCVPPIALWVRGAADLSAVLDRSVAIVGARASTSYGNHVAHDLASGLAESGLTIVSGGAVGIDTLAHRGSLAAGGVTIAVLACGINRSYPASNAQLFERIVADGAIVSEFPPGASPMRNRFLVRNRLIAGLTCGTVVVEAALRSGARSTAGRAREVGRAVMAVPGPVTSAAALGCLQMIRDEAAIAVGSAEHVLEAISLPGDNLASIERGEDRPSDDLDHELRTVLDAVPKRRPASADSIARTAARGAAEVMRGLAVLELLGHVEQRDGAWRLTSRA